MKLLAKQGLIKIQTIECEGRSCDIDLAPYFQVLGNPIGERQFKMYTVVFQKVRNIDVRDIELINKTLLTFDIPLNEIDLNLEDDVLHAKISNKVALKKHKIGRISA